MGALGYAAALFYLLAATFAVTFSLEAANAQSVFNTQLKAFTHTPFYAGLINRDLAALPPEVFHRCPTLRSNGSRVGELSPVTFAEDGYPIRGEWRQQFPVAGCGNDTTLNFYFIATAEEKINTVIGTPGETRADLRLQHDAQLFAVTGAMRLAGSCQRFVTINSAFDGAEASEATSQHALPQPWTETWTLQGCGRRFAVPLRFVPDATGTRIIQHGGAELR